MCGSRIHVGKCRSVGVGVYSVRVSRANAFKFMQNSTLTPQLKLEMWAVPNLQKTFYSVSFLSYQELDVCV